MKTKSALLFLVFLFIFNGRACADELSQAKLLFQQGNTHYIEGKFEETIADYEQVLNSGLESGPLYYNLGNAYFKNGMLGKAILNYLRARRLMPEDADLKANLDYARSLIKGGLIIPTRCWLIRFFFALADSFSLNGITLFSAAVYFLLSILIIFIILAKKLRRLFITISIPVLVFLILLLSLFSTQFCQTIIHKEAVVITPQADFKFEPFDEATTFFTLNEGETVFGITSRNNWIKVRRIDGKQGWIKKSDIAFI